MGWKTHLVQDRGATSFDLIARLPGSVVSISNCQYTDLLPPFIHHSAIRLQISLLPICYSHIETTTAWKQQQSRICCAGRKTVSSLNCPMCLVRRLQDIPFGRPFTIFVSEANLCSCNWVVCICLSVSLSLLFQSCPKLQGRRQWQQMVTGIKQQ